MRRVRRAPRSRAEPAPWGETYVDRRASHLCDGRDRVTLALYGAVPMEGTGAFLELVVETTARGTALPFRFDAVANEGLIPLRW